MIEPEIRHDVLLSTPSNGTVQDVSAQSAEWASGGKYKTGRTRPASSVLTEAHNSGWCDALNMSPRPRYFAQQHSDVHSVPGWIDVMVDELEASGAGLLAAVVAIKDTRGLSSTTVFDPVKRWHRRLTMREVYTLPETFGVEDIPWAREVPGAILCTNTGLWVCRFDGDWVEKIRFTITDHIFKNEQGLWEPAFWPEDWQFAEDAAKLGVVVKATRKIVVGHVGGFSFKNDKGWGSEHHDNWNPMEPPFTRDRPLPEGAHLGGFSFGSEPGTWAPEVWTELLRIYNPKKVVDLGAGEGQIAEWFAEHGCDVLAVEGAPEAVKACRIRGLRTEQVDLTVRKPEVDDVDLVWCSEFVEHVEERHVAKILDTFAAAKVVALTHAIPGDFGYHHVNCKPSDYWIEKLAERGFRYREDLSDRLRSSANEKARCIRRSLLVFEREAA
jgi:SAM-dependent methyltransferase